MGTTLTKWPCVSDSRGMRMAMILGPGMFRLGLALLVLVHHSTRLGLGAAAVYVFFCLSGYWMHAVWEGRYSKLPHGYLTFVFARYIRLLPLFWLCGLLAFGVELFLGKVNPAGWLSQTHSWIEWLHLVGPNVLILGYNWQEHMALVPAWSLDIEMQFYLLLPLLAWLVRSVGGRAPACRSGVGMVCCWHAAAPNRGDLPVVFSAGHAQPPVAMAA